MTSTPLLDDPVTRPALPFVLLTVLAVPLCVAALWVADSVGVHQYTVAPFVAIDAVAVIAVIVGVVGTIRRERHNVRARTDSSAAAAPADPYVWMAALALPVEYVAFGVAANNFSGITPVTIPVSALGLLVAGITCAIMRANARKAYLNAASPATSGVIGHTTDGEPIYPVVGQTADGTLITADRAVGVHPDAARTNAVAVIALVTAFFLPLIAVVLGHVARAQVRRTGERGDGLAVAALVIGYLAITVGLLLLVVSIALSRLP